MSSAENWHARFSAIIVHHRDVETVLDRESRRDLRNRALPFPRPRDEDDPNTRIQRLGSARSSFPSGRSQSKRAADPSYAVQRLGPGELDDV